MKRISLITASIMTGGFFSFLVGCLGSTNESILKNSGSIKLYGEEYYTLKNEIDQGKISSEDQEKLKPLLDNPAASWFGEWSGDIKNSAKSLVSNLPSDAYAMAVLYNIPNRDCGQHSSGGIASIDAYKQWIDGFVEGVGSKKVIVVIEPDALTLMDCLSEEQKNERFEMLHYAVTKVKDSQNKKVYIDAGHSAWVGASETANRLKLAGIKSADGFALNTSNYQTTENNINFGNDVIKSLGEQGSSKGFVIDTSRNGNGPNESAQGESAWCNVRGRAIGEKPKWGGSGNLHGLLWIKRPGESDGSCGGAPAAGQFWLEIALELVGNAK